MKKIFIFLMIFFWSMIFPSLSFNRFTTRITSDDISYLDLFDKDLRADILKNVEFDFFIMNQHP